MAFEKEELLEKILRAYSNYYDIERIEGDEYLRAEGYFHYHAENYVLFRSAQLYQMDSKEYVYFYEVPHLTRELYERLLKEAFEKGSARVQPDKNHRSSYVVAVFLCGSCEEDALKALQKCRMRKSFQFSLKGWMEMHTAMIDLGKESVVCNPDGRATGKFLKNVLHPPKQKGGLHNFFRR